MDDLLHVAGVRPVLTGILIFTLCKLSVQDRTSCSEVLGHPKCNLLPATCGTRPSVPRIYGGEVAFIGEYPWIARLEKKDQNASKLYLCGGSLISSRYVLTAAHCCLPAKDRYYLSVGEHDLGTDPDCTQDGQCAPPRQLIRAESFVTHERYNSDGKHNNDICLIRLEKDVIINDYVRPICLPVFDWFLEGNYTSLEVAGWGETETGSMNQLLKLTVQSYSQDKCKRFYWPFVSSSQICARGGEGNDACRGDSGGPLMGSYTLGSSASRYFVIGVVSFGSKYCGSPDPSVYARVTSYINWILDHMEP